MTTSAVIVDVHLSAEVLQRAGVPLEEALWFTRIATNAQVRQRALRTKRGASILDRVEQYARTAVQGLGFTVLRIA